MEDMGGSLLVYLYDASGSPIGMQYRNRIYDMGAYDNFWFEKNLQGDIVAVYDEDGTKLISYTYDAWGNFTTTYHNGCTASHIANLNPFRYRGYYYDAETGLYYLQSRYYDPVIGRFINADAYVSTGQGILGNNMFAYCNNNPINRIDKSGTSLEDLWDEFLEFGDTCVYAFEDLYYIVEDAFIDKIDLIVNEPFSIGSHIEHDVEFLGDVYWWHRDTLEEIKDTEIYRIHALSTAAGIAKGLWDAGKTAYPAIVAAPETAGVSLTAIILAGVKGFAEAYTTTAFACIVQKIME